MLLPVWLWDYVIATMINLGPQRRTLGLVGTVNYETMAH